MNERTKCELEHLLRLLAPPFTANWKAYCWHRAKELAQEPEMSELPALLALAMKPSPASTSPGK